MAYTKYSLTPANNTAAPPDGAPEGMLPSAVNDTMRDMMAQIRDVGDGVRDGTYTMTTPKITGGTITGVTLTGNTFSSPVISGGTINNATIGATTASTGSFTTLTSNGATTFTANTASTSTTTGTTVITGGLGVSGRVNAANFDGIVGANTAAAGSFTTINASTSITNAGLTSGRVTFAGASGLLSDSSTFVFNGTSLGVGTSSPDAILDVTRSGNGQIAVLQTTATRGFSFESSSDTAIQIASIQASTNLDLFANTLSFSAGGSERMRISSTGLVGIGTSSPLSLLHVNASDGVTGVTIIGGGNSNVAAVGEINAQLDFRSNDASVNNTNQIGGRIASVTEASNGAEVGLSFYTFQQGAATPLSEKLRITYNGNVGIGTSSPQANLQVTSSAFPVLKVADAVGGGAVALGDSTITSNYVGIWRGAVNSISGGGFLNVQGNGIAFMSTDNVFGSATRTMTLDNSGNLLLGTTASNYRLNIKGAGTVGDSSVYAQFTTLDTGTTATDGLLIGLGVGSSPAAYVGQYENAPLIFLTNGTEKVRIDSSGNLLVGTTSGVTNGGFSFEPNYNGGGVSAAFFGHSSSGGSGNQYCVFAYNGTFIGSIAQDSTTGVLYNTTSDQRLKTNIVNASSGNIDNIKVRSFDWLSNGNHQEYGMVAQELIEVAPYAVHKPENPDEMMGVDYSKLVPMMIKEIQDLKAEVNQLKAKIGV